MQKACGNYAIQIAPNWLVTLTFRSNEVSDHFARNTMANFLNRTNRDVFGRHSKERMYLMVVQEKNYSNGIHYHLLVRDPAEQTRREHAKDLRGIFKKHWQKMPYNGYEAFTPRADSSFKPVNGDGSYEPNQEKWFEEIDDVGGVSEYVTKQIGFNTDAIDWELSNFPISSGVPRTR